jgi:uncharacterized membrane protein (DUF373 family)
MGIVVVAATMELGYILFRCIIEPPGLLLDISELFELFGLFMMVLIAIELMSSIYAYFTNKAIYLEMMFLIAITAVTRKIVVLDAKSIESMAVIGLAAILAALVAGYYVVKKTADRN